MTLIMESDKINNIIATVSYNKNAEWEYDFFLISFIVGYGAPRGSGLFLDYLNILLYAGRR